jgi:glucose/arabinose dehydrogenase
MRLGALLASSLFAAALVQPVQAQTPPPQPAPQAASPSMAPLFCTISSAHTCTGAACTKAETFGDLKLPVKLLVHFDSHVIASTNADGFPHISQIASFAKTGNDYVLQGVDHASGWMLHLDEAGTKMSAAITTSANALIASGTCKKAS